MSIFDALALENAAAQLATADLSPTARHEVDALQTAAKNIRKTLCCKGPFAHRSLCAC